MSAGQITAIETDVDPTRPATLGRQIEQAEALLGEWLADPRNEQVAQHFGR